MPLTQRAAALLLCAVWLAEVAGTFVPSRAIATASGAALAAFTLIAWARSSRHVKALFAVALGASAAMAWSEGSAAPLVEGFGRAILFGAFMPAVLLLRATVEASPRLGTLRRDLGRLDHAATQNWTLYGGHALGAFLNVGASAILAPFVGRGADDRLRAELAAACARGVAMGAMWSPFYLSVAFVGQLAPSVPLWHVVVIGMAATLLGLALAQLIVTPGLDWKGFRASVASLAPLAAPTLLIVAAVVGASLAFHWNGLRAVAVVVPLLCVLYLARLPRETGDAVFGRAFASFGRVADELVIVVGGAVLGAVVSALPAVRELSGAVTPEMISGPAVIGAMVATLVLLGQAGLHPIVSTSVMVPIVMLGDFGVSDTVAACAAVFAWGLNGCVSIWSLPMAMSASAFGVTTGAMITRRGLAFVLALGIGGVALLSAINAA